MDKLYSSARTRLSKWVNMDSDALDELVYMYVYSETAASVREPLFNLLKADNEELNTDSQDFLE